MTKQELVEMIRPLPDAVWQADYFIGHFDSVVRMAKDYGGLNMTPDFQRGHVWNHEQGLKFCESFVRKFIPPHLLTFQFNCPHWNGDISTDLPREIQCIDGLQRLTAIQKMMAGEILPFGVHVSEFDGTTLQMTRINRTIKIQMHAFKTKRELLQYYLDLNEGSTPHSLEELERVRKMLKLKKP